MTMLHSIKHAPTPVLRFTPAWLDVNHTKGWVGRVTGSLPDGRTVAVYVGGNPHPNAAGMTLAARSAEAYARALAGEFPRGAVRVVAGRHPMS